MATLVLNPCNTRPYHYQQQQQQEQEQHSLDNDESNSNSIIKTSDDSNEPLKVSKFFSSSCNYQSKIQQLISFSFTSSNFIFITFILSISKLCTTAATDASQTGAPQPSTAMPSFLMMPNISGSALMEKLNSIRANTGGGPPSPQPPPTSAVKAAVKGKNSPPAAANSLTVVSTATAGPIVADHGGSGSGSSSSGGGSTIASSKISSPSLIVTTTTASPSDSNSLIQLQKPSLNAFSLFASVGRNDLITLHKDLKFLNVSGKIGTPLGIGNLTNKCSEKQFQCGNGNCIPVRFLCDGDSDCADHSDEMIPECRFRG
ncbi:hypothetical protein DOY81_001104, partial [Sarcophaga bullata]